MMNIKIFITIFFLSTSLVMSEARGGRENVTIASAAQYLFNRNVIVRRTCTSEYGVPYLVPLLSEIVQTYMSTNVVVLLYDEYFYFSSSFQLILDNLLKMSISLRHGKLDTSLATPRAPPGFMQVNNNERLAFIVFSKDIDVSGEAVVGNVLSDTKVVLISQSSSYQVNQYLSSKSARRIVNLLVIVDMTLKVDLYAQRKRNKIGECDIMLYTHKMYADALGNSHPMIITAWRRDSFTRTNITLFPDKFKGGLNGLHLIVSASNKPPFVFRKRCPDVSEPSQLTTETGLEVRLIKLLGKIMNFTVEFKEPSFEANDGEDTADVVLNELLEGRVQVALGGMYMTSSRYQLFSFIFPHIQDCASFISLTSTALPKYRAIMGPFLWDVWLALTIVYLLAIVPISFSVWHTFTPITNDFKELENMFWYVFGTFTNCFSFSGTNSWSRGDKTATRFFIGTYWVFTIIITACYTGSIIAFITLPVFPEVIDTTRQFVEEKYKLSTIRNGIWHSLVNESSDPVALQLLPDIDLVSDYIEGLRNVSESVKRHRKSVFLGSKHLLEYVVRTNYTPEDTSKRLLFHISKECFVPLMVSLAFPPGSYFIEHMNVALENLIQAGFLAKIIREVDWIIYRSSTGNLLQERSTGLRTPPEDRELTLDDTQGMFLLLGAGFAIAVAALTGEIVACVWKETRAPPEFGKPTLGERILERIYKWAYKCKGCLLSPIEVQERLSRLFLDRRESTENRNLSELFGSEVDREMNNDRIYNNRIEIMSTIHLQAPRTEQPIRLRSF
uniref:Ionotropic glutamate receptor C-terminal domain-containing protein n=1 Tax=Rhodnius prolixus TaxID=13249 RepID=T1HCR2_RHOPR